jgi:hypothetical protein
MHEFFKNLFWILIWTGCIINCRAGDDSAAAGFFDSVASRFYNEYRECTGDMRPADLQRVLMWKRKIDALVQSKEFIELLHDYRKNVDSVGSISPCKLIAWSKSRKQKQDSLETKLLRAILDSNEAADAMSDLSSCKQSSLDFADIPFGVSKATLKFLFKKRFERDLPEKDGFLYSDAFPIKGRPYLVAMYFNSAGAFCKYQIESDVKPADSLNRVVRPAMEHLAIFFETRLGPPLHSYRIGFFDIKSKELAVYKKWEMKKKSLFLGLSVSDYQYYAKAIVSDANLMSVKAASGDGISEDQ